MKYLFTVLALSLSISAQASTRVNNGLLNDNIVYLCEEKNPADAENPYIAAVRKTKNGLVLAIQQKQSEDLEYYGAIERNKAIMCVLACDIFENVADQVEFGVTTLGKLKQGYFASPTKAIQFKCEEYQR